MIGSVPLMAGTVWLPTSVGVRPPMIPMPAAIITTRPVGRSDGDDSKDKGGGEDGSHGRIQVGSIGSDPRTGKLFPARPACGRAGTPAKITHSPHYPGTMRNLLLLIVPLFAALPLPAVTNGDPLAAVIAEKGEPKSKLEHGNTTVLTYATVVIQLKDGVVVSQRNPSADYAVRAEAAKPLPPSKSGAAAGTSGSWATDYQSALTSANGTGRKVFLFFTGSDWCGWCRRLDAEILGTEEFRAYASGSLVLVKLDFPRHLEQSEQTKTQNADLAQRYRISGYPTVVILNDSGAEIGRLGYQRGGPGPFLQRLQRL